MSQASLVLLSGECGGLKVSYFSNHLRFLNATQPSLRIPHQTTGEQLRQKLTFPPGCRVTAEVKHNPTNAVVCRVQGEWNGALEFSYTSGETRVVDVTKLPVTRKNVRPIEKQGPTESRLGRRREMFPQPHVRSAGAQISLCVAGGCGST